jgi:hypothetical protein
VWSDEALLMVRPFARYRVLAAEDEDKAALWIAIRRPLLWLLVIGAFVSFTTAGRWVLLHVLFASAMWAFVPLYQIAWLLPITRMAGSKLGASKTIDLFFAGQGPWLCFALALAAVCLFAPDVWPAFRWLLGSGVLFIAFGLTLVWSALITVAFFKSALALRTRLAILATFAFYVGFDGTIAAWYFATGQLVALIGGSAG